MKKGYTTKNSSCFYNGDAGSNSLVLEVGEETKLKNECMKEA